MSANTPEMLDAWRMVAARRGFQGSLPLSALTRLHGLILDTEGEVAYLLQFDSNAMHKLPFVTLQLEAMLPLECQRGLHRFLLPVQITQHLGLIHAEAEEAALPPDFEALLVPEDGMLCWQDLIEDELVLAIPVVPLDPQGNVFERDWPAPQEEIKEVSPFAALASLKKN